MKPFLDPDRLVQHLRDRREAVRRAGGVRNDDVVLRQLVVIDAVNHGEVASFRRGPRRGRFAPASRWAFALSFAVKRPVHLRARCRRRAPQQQPAGFLIAVTLIFCPSTTIESPSTLTRSVRGPCTESKRRRWAFVSTGPRPFYGDHLDVLAPGFTMARRYCGRCAQTR